MVESGEVGSKMVKLRVDMRVYTEKFQFFNVKYHAIIEIVECESARVAQKWSSASRICEYAGTRPFPKKNPLVKFKKEKNLNFCSPNFECIYYSPILNFFR